MKSRRKWTRWLPFLVGGAFLFAGCGGQDVPEHEIRMARPVVVRALQEETRDETLDYLGIVSTESTVKAGFKTGGKIARIGVSKGDVVTAGMELAALDTTELQLGVDAAEAQLAAARAQYQKAVNGAEPEDVENARLNVSKAQDARDYAADLLQKTQALFAEGAAAQAELDQIQLELDIRENELKQAKALLAQVQGGARNEDVRALSAQVAQAEAQLALQTRALTDAVLIAEADGTVLEVLQTEGELVGAGYPVVVLGTDVRTVTTGVTAADSRIILPGMKVLVGAAETPGAVLRVSDVPDPATLTYEVEISVDARAGGASTGAAAGTETVQDKLTAGEVVGVRFVTGKVTGIWIPLTAVSAQGDRHVFLAQGGIAYRTAVTLNETHGMQVRVDGLSAGDLLILEGAHRLTEGDLLDVTQEEAAP